MSAGRSDASTSTDDMKGRPLCLFYFTQPFGVLSPEPPTALGAAPAHVARAFFDMQPVSPARFYWGAEGAPGGGAPEPRRPLAYHRTLPPLRLPSARTPSASSEELWPRKCLLPEKFSLPPIELPARSSRRGSARAPAAPSAGRTPRARPARGVRKPRPRRARAAHDVRRALACLVRRAVTGHLAIDKIASVSMNEYGLQANDGRRADSPSPALARVLHVLRDAWPEPVACCAPTDTPPAAQTDTPPAAQTDTTPAAHTDTPPAELTLSCTVSDSMERWTAATSPPPPATSPPPPAHASPGLLRRRYSVPETIMRKYRLAQQHSAFDRGESTGDASSACPWPAREPPQSPAESPQRFLRRDRELMRKSALLRRLWARPCADACVCETRATRSLDGSRSELSSRFSPARAPAADHKRQRLEPPPAPADLSASTFRSHGEPHALCSCDTMDCTECGSPTPAADDLSAARDTSGSSPPPAPLRRAGTPLYELLEIVVSESADGTADFRSEDAPQPALALSVARDVDIDEYVSNILVESLNSLTDQLETMNASIGGRRISIVEKEIKVRLQNAGVNTIVHLSPTSNNQIIFGNEELCNEPRGRDECNNPLAIREERGLALGSGDNLTSSAGSAAPPQPAPEREPPRDDVNRAVLQQIQKLFRDELREMEEGAAAGAGVSLVEISDVDDYLAAHDAAERQVPAPHSRDAPIAGVGAGNYFRDGGDAAAVLRFSAFPHTESMEVNTSSSEGEAACSECVSLVDSLDDPNSPRVVAARRRGDAVRSAGAAPAQPERARPASTDSRGEAFFVRIEDGDLDRLEDNVRVAEFMPEKIKQRLVRRHRKRELRMECARRSKVKQLKRELERRRLEDAAAARRRLERDCEAIVDALLDDVVARVAREEYSRLRAPRRPREPPPARRTRRREHLVRGQLLARPSLPLPPTPARPPRRLYQKSEIREGEKCIEILEILEYVNGSPSSPESNSDENHNHNSKCKKSRIPVPVYERIRRASEGERRMRLTGGDWRSASPPGEGSPPPSRPRAPPESPPAPEPRSRSNSLLFKRVFDIIPEERSLSLESPAEDAEPPRRPPPAPEPPPAPPPPATRSAGTSPAERRCALRSQTTMTSPCSRSAATSPLRPPTQNAAPPREGRGREKLVEEESSAGRARVPEGAPGAAASSRRMSAEASARRGGSSSSDSGDSGGSLLCSLAPRWLGGPARQRRRARRPPPAPEPRSRPHPPPPPPDPPSSECAPDSGGTAATAADSGPGGWTVTVAGSCRAALPADVEMRLRFPGERTPIAGHRTRAGTPPCACVQCARCAARGGARAALPPASAASEHNPRLTLTMKKEAQDSSILASKSVRKSSELPELETYRASRTNTKSSVKARRAYSLHCWLPDDERAPIRANNGLSVLGCAIIPELKPRVPTMSERDLTRVYTPRHYLRS